MTKPNRIALGRLPALLAAGLLAHAGGARAAAPAADAQTQARGLLLAAGGPMAPAGARPEVRFAAAAGDAALSARALILGGEGRGNLQISARVLQARVTSLAGSRAARDGRQDAQAQARRLIHGGAA